MNAALGNSRFSDALSPVWHADPTTWKMRPSKRVLSLKWQPIIPDKRPIRYPPSWPFAIFQVSTDTAKVNFGKKREEFLCVVFIHIADPRSENFPCL